MQIGLAAAEVPDVPVRFGTHPTFERMVFDWREPVEYRVETDGPVTVLSFDRAARVDVSAITKGLARLGATVELDAGATQLKLRVTLPASMQLKHFRSGTKVVLDFARRRDAPEASTPTPVVATGPGAGGTTPAAAAAPKRAAAAPQEKAVPQEKATPQEKTASQEKTAAPQRPISLRPSRTAPAAGADAPQLAVAPPQPAAVATPAKDATAPAAAPVSVPVEVVRTADGEGLRFGWSQPVGAAVFGRGTHLWIVFDRPASLDLAMLRGREELLGPVEILEPQAGEGTVVRLAPAGGSSSVVRREGDAWVVEIGRLPRPPDVPIAVAARRTEDPMAARLVVEVPDVRSIIQVRDPDAGDELIVAPTSAAGTGFERARDYLQFRLLSTAQGVAVQKRADALSVRPIGTGIEIGSTSGLFLSHVRHPSYARTTRDVRAPYLFDFAAWRRRGPERFIEDQQILRRAIATAGETERNRARLELARFMFAYGNMRDVLGLLRLIEQEDPGLVATTQVRAMWGVAALLVGDVDEAERHLKHPSLDSQPEAALWRGALAMVQGDARTARVQLGRSADLYRNYPAPFANRLNLLNAEARVFTGDYPGAESLIDAVLANQPTASEHAQAMYLRGRLALAQGDREKALQIWGDLERAPLTPARTAAALDRIELLVEDSKMSQAEAIAALDRLRFSWRGDELEFRILTRLGRLQLAAKDYRAGLATLRNALRLFPNHREAKSIIADMSAAFTAAFESAGEEMSPVTAIAMFEEFRELVPVGQRGDEMAQRLIDRLISVDLLDRAGDLLEHQIKFRLSGEEKAKAGTKLALVRLLDRKPEAALEALKLSADAGMAAPLVLERARLEARALADLGRTAEALQRLEGDGAREADELRADILWRAQDWAGAAKVLSRLVGAPTDAGLPDEDARRAIHLAVALSLADDREGLKQLDARIGTAMRQGPYADIYKVVVSETGGPAADVQDAARRAAAAAPFQSFLASYRERLLSAPETGS